MPLTTKELKEKITEDMMAEFSKSPFEQAVDRKRMYETILELQKKVKELEQQCVMAQVMANTACEKANNPQTFRPYYDTVEPPTFLTDDSTGKHNHGYTNGR